MSIWHFLVIPVAAFPLYGIPISLFIWSKTKDPNNRWLKILYRCRFVYGCLVLLTFLNYFIPGNTVDLDDIGAVYAMIGGITAKLVMAWALMTSWAKPKNDDESAQ